LTPLLVIKIAVLNKFQKKRRKLLDRIMLAQEHDATLRLPQIECDPHQGNSGTFNPLAREAMSWSEPL
jgi:hypothetical protein